MANVVGVPSGDLSESGIDTGATVYWNLDNISLIDLAVERKEGFLTSEGALVTETGERTGRSPNDKFIVDEPTTNQDVNWGDVNISTDKEVFTRLKNRSSNTYLQESRYSSKICTVELKKVKHYRFV